jgi:hypothetical protein
MTDKRELLAQIEALIDQAQKLVWEAEEIADEHGLSFSMNLGSYGMGGYYDGGTAGEEDEYGDIRESGWNASSQSC